MGLVDRRRVVRQRLLSAAIVSWVLAIAIFYLLQYVEPACEFLGNPFDLCPP